MKKHLQDIKLENLSLITWFVIMEQKYGESDPYQIIAENSNVFYENFIQNEKLEPIQVFGNEWQNFNHNSWFQYCNHRPCCPIVHSNPISFTFPFQSSVPFNEYPNRMNSMNSSVPELERTLKNKCKKPSQHLTEDMDKESPNLDKVAKVYFCKLCSQMYGISDRLAFRAHIEMHLEKIRPFICKICGKYFKFRSTCRNHMMAHMVVRNHFN